MLGRNGDVHVHMVWHEMPFKNVAFLLPNKRVENSSQVTARRPEDRPWRGLGTNMTWYLRSHLEGDGLRKRSDIESSSSLVIKRFEERSTPDRLNLFKSLWSNQLLTNFSCIRAHGGS